MIPEGHNPADLALVFVAAGLGLAFAFLALGIGVSLIIETLYQVSK